MFSFLAAPVSGRPDNRPRQPFRSSPDFEATLISATRGSLHHSERLTGQPYARVVPDILIERSDADPTARLAIGAKYKLYDERKLSSTNVYQSFLYAYAYGAAGGPVLPAALLVYPSSSRSSHAVRLHVRNAQALAAAEILALGRSIPDVLAEVTSQLRGSATKALMEAVQQGLWVSQHTAA